MSTGVLRIWWYVQDVGFLFLLALMHTNPHPPGKLITMYTKTSTRFTQVNGTVMQVKNTYAGYLHVCSVRNTLAAGRRPDHIAALTSFPGAAAKNRKKDLLKWVEGKLANAAAGKDPHGVNALWKFMKLALDSDGKLFSR